MSLHRLAGLFIFIGIACVACEKQQEDVAPEDVPLEEAWFSDGRCVNSFGWPTIGMRCAVQSFNGIKVHLTPLIVTRRIGRDDKTSEVDESSEQGPCYYFGWDCAAVPMTDKPYTAFYLQCFGGAGRLSLEPERAVLVDEFQKVYPYKRIEGLYSDFSPPRTIPLWNRNYGFLFFDPIEQKEIRLTVKIPYCLKAETSTANGIQPIPETPTARIPFPLKEERGELCFEFQRKMVNPKVPWRKH